MPFDPSRENTPKVHITEALKTRMRVADTDLGQEMSERISDLKELVAAYRAGVLKEKE